MLLPPPVLSKFLIPLALLSGCGHEQVVRVMDGDTVVGRFIDERAYDSYLRGAILEHEGRLEEAEAAYQVAHDIDLDGAAPLVRLAAVRCARGDAGALKRAEEAFEAAEQVERRYAPLYTERARCWMLRSQPQKAQADARTAMSLDPKDEDTTVVLARSLESLGKLPEAVDLLVGFVVWRPQAPMVWSELDAISRKSPSAVEPWLGRIRTRNAEPKSVPHVATPEALARIDQAIASGDVATAREEALRARLGASAIALRAAALGQWTVSIDEAVVILSADPEDADARVALFSQPDLEQARGRLGEWAWERIVARTAAPPRPSPFGALLLANALQRRLGPDAAQAFLRGYGPIASDPSDPLREALRGRLASP